MQLSVLSFLSKNRTNHNDYFDRTTASKGKWERGQKGKNRVPSFNVTSPDMMTTFPPALARGHSLEKPISQRRIEGSGKLMLNFPLQKFS